MFYFILLYVPPGADGVMTSEAILENPALFTSNMDDKNNYRTLVDLAGNKLKQNENDSYVISENASFVILSYPILSYP